MKLRKLLLPLILLSVSAFAQLTDPNLQAAQAEFDGLTSQVSTLNSLNADLKTQIDTLTATITQDQATISQLSGQDGSYQGQILSLQQQLAAALSAGQIPSQLVKQYINLQQQSGWVLASGSAANTGATGSLGTATLTPNADGTATFAIQPTGPYYDAFFFRPLAGTWYSRVLPPAPRPNAGYFVYHVEWYLDAVNLPLAQCVEVEARWYDGTYMYQMAGQIKMSSKTLRYYDPNIPNWVDTKVPVNIQAGVWEPIDLLYQAKNGTTTFVGAIVDGVYFPMSIPIKAATKSTQPWIHTSIQLDSNSSGKPYQAQVRNISLAWF